MEGWRERSEISRKARGISQWLFQAVEVFMVVGRGGKEVLVEERFRMTKDALWVTGGGLLKRRWDPSSSGHQEGDFSVLSFKSKCPDVYNGQDVEAT